MICLQEVKWEFHNRLFESEWAKKYKMAKIRLKGHHTLILSKFPCKFYYSPLPTEKTRHLHYVMFKLNGENTAIASVHLESHDKPEFRRLQLEKIFEIFKNFDKAIIVGDTNLKKAEASSISPEYLDVWPSLYKEKGITMPSYDPSKKSWRPDRFLLRKDSRLKPIKMEILGTNILPIYEQKTDINKYEVKTPSDHFAIKGIFQIEKEIN